MFSIRPVAVLALVPFLLQPRVEEFGSRHEKDTVLVSTFETTGAFELDEVVMEVAGEEHSPDEVPEFSIGSLERIVVTDEIQAVEEGALRKLRRTFDTLEERNTFGSEDGSDEKERESALEGEVVVFTWDADAEEWKKKAENEDLDGDLLQGLRADLSFAEFLPKGEVAEGDTWEVPEEAFALLFAPAGELMFEGDEENEDPENRARISRELLENISGTITAKYAGKRDEDGVEVAVIELEMDVQSEAELNSSEEATQSLELTRELEGELLWLAAEGRMHSLHAEGDGSETMTSEGSFETPDGAIEVVQRQTFRGTRTYRFSVEKR